MRLTSAMHLVINRAPCSFTADLRQVKEREEELIPRTDMEDIAAALATPTEGAGTIIAATVAISPQIEQRRVTKDRTNSGVDFLNAKKHARSILQWFLDRQLEKQK